MCRLGMLFGWKMSLTRRSVSVRRGARTPPGTSSRCWPSTSGWGEAFPDQPKHPLPDLTHPADPTAIDVGGQVPSGAQLQPSLLPQSRIHHAFQCAESEFRRSSGPRSDTNRNPMPSITGRRRHVAVRVDGAIRERRPSPARPCSWGNHVSETHTQTQRPPSPDGTVRLLPA